MPDSFPLALNHNERSRQPLVKVIDMKKPAQQTQSTYKLNGRFTMRSMSRILCVNLACVFLTASPLHAAPTSATAQHDVIKQKLAGLQIPFIENKGQVSEAVAFFAPTFAGTVFVTKKGDLVYALPVKNTDADGASRATQVLTERFLAGQAAPIPLTAGATKVSFFLGNDRAKWQRTVSTNSAVSLGEVWRGIDVELHAYGNNVEKFFTVRPGASVEAIRVQLDGAQSLKISQEGALDVVTASGVVRFTPPVAWQEKAGGKLPVQVAYVVTDETYSFKLGQYDVAFPVVIDPLLQSTYLGATGYDSAASIAIDPVSGDVYVAGTTTVTDFPGTTGGAQVIFGGGSGDIFVARLNRDLTFLFQSSYLGGSGYDTQPSVVIHLFHQFPRCQWRGAKRFWRRRGRCFRRSTQ